MSVHLSRGTMPCIGLGVYQTPPDATAEVVNKAIHAGYRMIDTAALYRNEEGVGQGVVQSGVPREHIYITTKLWNSDHGYDNTIKACEKSLRKLNTSYIDLYLMHSPCDPGTLNETWAAMEELKQRGVVRDIGVSNFGIHHLQKIERSMKVAPLVNQIELHPFLQRRELVEYCKSKKIALQAYSPLAKAEKMDDPRLARIAQKYRRTPAQILIRWSIQKGFIPLPKTTHAGRLAENLDVLEWSIEKDDMATIDGWDENLITGWDPISWPA